MRALNRLVNTGKVHYLGLSDAPAWVALKANDYAQQHGLAQFSLFQGQYNAAIRDCEREIIPVCEDTGVSGSKLNDSIRADLILTYRWPSSLMAR